MVDGSYAKTGLLHALAQLPKQPRSSLRDLRALFSGNKERTLLYEQIERDRLRLQQKVQEFEWAAKRPHHGRAARGGEDLPACPASRQLPPLQDSMTRPCAVRVISTGRSAIRSWRRIAAICAWMTTIVRVLTLKELPGETRPLILNGLLDIPANFHVVTEWHPVDNAKARKEIASRRRHHHNSKTSFVSNLQDRQNTGPQDESGR